MAQLATTIPDPQASLRQQLRVILVAWLFGSFWLWTVSGAVMTRFGRSIGMPDAAFGLLGALPFLGSLAQLPASYMLERFGRRRAMFLWFGAIGRGLWALGALIPWVLWWWPGAWWPGFMVVLTLSWVAANIASPAWMSWMADVIPHRVRGRFFGQRNLIGQPIGLLVTVAVGWALDVADAASPQRPGLMLQVTAGILAIAGLVGMLDILCFRGVPDPRPAHRRHGNPWWHSYGQALRDRYFRRYLAFNFTFTLSVGFIAQYVWLYAFDEVGWSSQQANLLLIGVPLMLRMVTYRAWGRAVDRLGKKPVMIICGSVVIVGPLGWLLIGPDQWVLGYCVMQLTSLVIPGLEIANFNLMLGLAGRKEQGGGTAMVAINSSAIAMGGVLSGVLGAAVASWFADLRIAMPVGGDLTYHGLLFVISMLLRTAALIPALGLNEPSALATRDALSYMTGATYSNVRQAVLLPTRIVGDVVRWSYRIGRNGRGHAD